MESPGIPQEVLDKTVNAPRHPYDFSHSMGPEPVGQRLKEAFQYFMRSPEGQKFTRLPYSPGGRGHGTQPEIAPAKPPGDPRQEPGGGQTQQASVPTYDDLGSYARASQLAGLTGVPAFIFQGKLYRPGDSQNPVQAAPAAASAPTALPAGPGLTHSPPMDRPELTTAAPPSSLPRPASQSSMAGMFAEGGGRN